MWRESQITYKPSLALVEGPVKDFKITGEPWRRQEKNDVRRLTRAKPSQWG